MRGFAKFAYRVAGPFAEKRVHHHRDLQNKLFQAHLPVRAGVYLAQLYVTAALAAVVGLVVPALILLAFDVKLVIVVFLPLLTSAWFAVAVFVLAPVFLKNRATEVAKGIDESLPAGLNYLLALANAGLPPVAMWGSLARAKVFGPLAYEAERIHRDLAIFSHDILHALRDAQARTPSAPFHEFLQGAISAFQSGVELESYLKTKGAQYQHESVEQQRKVLDTMGVIAEAFLVVVVAAPLFLIILLTVMAINQGEKVMFFGFLLTFVFIPMTQLLIGGIIRGMNSAGS